MKEETKKKLKKYGKLAVGAALLGGAAYAGYKNRDAIMDVGKKAYDGIKEIPNVVKEKYQDVVRPFKQAYGMLKSDENQRLAQAQWDLQAKAALPNDYKLPSDSTLNNI